VLCVSGYPTFGIPTPNYTCETTAYPPQEQYKLPWFQVDLSADAKHRWDEIITTYKDPIKDLVDQLIHLVSLVDPSGKILKIVDDLMPALLVKFPREYREEIEGISEASGIQLGRIVTYNIFYELFSVCTSIVAENGQSGEHFHARNLDFGLFMGWDMENHTWTVSEILRRMEFNVEFVKDGRPLFNMSSFAGYVGTLNGVKAGQYSISLNERFVLEGGFVGLYEWIVKHEDLYFPTWLARDVLTDNHTYDEALDILQNRAILAPCYYIVSGVEHNQGHLITRGLNESLYPLQLNAEEGRWYLLETNYDHWKKPFFLDNRRNPGEKCMNESSYDTISKAHIFNVLSSDPVLNQLTVFTTLMNPQTGEMESYRQFCPTCYIW